MRMTSWNGGRPTRPSSQPSIVPGADADDLAEPGARVTGRFAALLQESREGVLLEGHGWTTSCLRISGYPQSTRLIRWHTSIFSAYELYYSVYYCYSRFPRIHGRRSR